MTFSIVSHNGYAHISEMQFRFKQAIRYTLCILASDL